MPAKDKRLSIQFFQETWVELKKVVWPSRKQATNLTLIVIAVSVAVGLLLGTLDFAFYLFFQQFLLPLR